ncbi:MULTISPECIES: class I SAM-dependent methyltransferase [unclassified Sporosarcina]|uniref:class I SAM-dependent methyltransferase n=1 Tax=unclassified Sporosarcina TaxID=2647733 RepID=UPI000C16C313|nr:MULTISPECIES: class I SAM-dependent methyltransferase [unclassified Sporosarcina]PID00868.1 SAM-dependent methyltransferase [Sporosarcina sp. P29]PID07074.1 SAM-dependent methyltransferase [Sporosarcina sp. P30]PID10270.1 SAM-dependent methyltransferase [Sporosarcina sp. P31]PID12168.1 SAM-dependent methyltransferase [Sporosarcina sp. P32b]
MVSVFPKIYDMAMKPLEATRFKKVRTELIRHAQGNVLEIGSGTGINFPYYQQAKHVTAIEPNPEMSRRATRRGRNAHVPITLYEANAESLPFADHTFDTVISTLVFCTIPNPLLALKEIQRVSKPGATILFFEHVKMKQPTLAKAQDLVNPLWEKVCDGCQLNRDTLSMIVDSGIYIEQLESLYGGLFLSIRCINDYKELTK